MKMVRERVIIEKCVFHMDGPYANQEFYRTLTPIGPELFRDYQDGEPMRPHIPENVERQQIGWWKRLMQAVRRHGPDGNY